MIFFSVRENNSDLCLMVYRRKILFNLDQAFKKELGLFCKLEK
jgi:hypothetical protein